MSEDTCSICGSPHHLALIHDHLRHLALWFPPYAGSGTQAQGTVAKSAARTFTEALKAHEDKVTEVIGNFDDAERAIAYKYLHASGLRIGTADEDLRKAIHKEINRIA